MIYGCTKFDSHLMYLINDKILEALIRAYVW